MRGRPASWRIWVICALSLLTANEASAAEYVVTADPTQSNVQFTLDDVLHTVHGMFKVQNGTIRFDPSTGAAKGQVIVDVPSGNSGSPSRDHRMQKEILQSQAYPEAVFVPDHVVGAFSPEGDSDLQIHGTISIHGGKHDVTLPSKVRVQNGAFKADAAFVLPYVEWGMKNPSNFVLRVNEKVALNLHLVGTIAPAAN